MGSGETGWVQVRQDGFLSVRINPSETGRIHDSGRTNGFKAGTGLRCD